MTRKIIIMSCFTFIFACKSKDKQPVKKIDTTKVEVNHNASTTTLEKDTVVQIKDNPEKLLSNIEGIYKSTNDKNNTVNCNMTIEIYKEGNQLKYHIVSKIQDLRGNLILKLTEDKDKYDITLVGIEWSENEGAIEPEGTAEEENDIDLPQNLEAVFNGEEIYFQNYGNVMNYYVVLSECGDKYISFLKQR